MEGPVHLTSAFEDTLGIINPTSPPQFIVPSKRIYHSHDLPHFLTSHAYRDVCVFILQLNRSLCPRIQPEMPHPVLYHLHTNHSLMPSVRALQELITAIQLLIRDFPPEPGPRRFGNISFRKWHEMLSHKVGVFLGLGPIGDTLQRYDSSASSEVVCYLLASFGNTQRLDYGTGHELNFIAFIGCLWKLGHFNNDPQGGDVEREIVLGVIERYLKLVRNLIVTYNLEPAGSHGVWGLDDYSFMPYIFGSAQLAQPIKDNGAMSTKETIQQGPKPGDITQSSVVEDQRRLNMYFSAIHFINEVKKGPFWEHSPMLFDISGIRDGWGKINKGMIKMFNAEVLAKFPVVQHFPFGSLFSWDTDLGALKPSQGIHMASSHEDMSLKGTGPAATIAPATRCAPSSGRDTLSLSARPIDGETPNKIESGCRQAQPTPRSWAKQG